ncbi:MAG: hypothetical protein Q9P01_20240 [Anaerolineae bacterium]|nr:hypothetical protein [Anaerolineae bacterium]MDQ7037080.1 hypothetical protein [Anaerolineae bacterium]
MYTLLLHIADSPEPVKAEVDELPDPSASFLVIKNPRLRSEKEIRGLEDGVTMLIYPWWRINYIQVLPSGDDELDFPLLYRD